MSDFIIANWEGFGMIANLIFTLWVNARKQSKYKGPVN